MLKKDDIILDAEKNEYKIIEAIGSGGMGFILSAQRLSDDQKFAVKTLPVFFSGNGDYRALINEGNLAEGINHKNVIKYIYFHNGETYPSLPPYIIMELADEGTLQDLIESHRAGSKEFEEGELLNLYFKLTDGMEAINKVLVHRDIKPSNILFKDGELKISDFGIAKIAGDPTRTASFKGSGTLAFLPPEAFLNQENSIQMDIYSMGIVFYILATLQHPYEAKQAIKNEDDWKNAHLYVISDSVKKLNPKLSLKISTTIAKMIEKDPRKRFTNWEEIRKELQAVGNLGSSTHVEAIEKMLAKSLEKKTKFAQEQSEREKVQQAKDQKEKIIMFQFDNDIVKPLKDFIDEYNTINSANEDQITIRKVSSSDYWSKDSIYHIKGGSWGIVLTMHSITEEDYRSREYDGDSRGQRYIKKIAPELKGKKVIAWGFIEDGKGRGFNLILCESNKEGYSDWYILENTHSPMARHNDGRPDPFPFGLSEIIEEIQYLGAIHIFQTNIYEFSAQKLIDFISDQD
jgi:serine/threonine protein kinase